VMEKYISIAIYIAIIIVQYKHMIAGRTPTFRFPTDLEEHLQHIAIAAKPPHPFLMIVVMEKYISIAIYIAIAIVQYKHMIAGRKKTVYLFYTAAAVCLETSSYKLYPQSKPY